MTMSVLALRWYVQVMAVFCGPTMVKVNVIRSIGTQIANKESLTSLILVLQSNITNQAMKAVDIWPFRVEIFQVHVFSVACVIAIQFGASSFRVYCTKLYSLDLFFFRQ